MKISVEISKKLYEELKRLNENVLAAPVRILVNAVRNGEIISSEDEECAVENKEDK